ncbi:CPBP family intramembrane glutamic endopeptidase [Zoogloea sp.]|uniref:CPBP family intramembrane glutamic endopeptidase n=1 Tax=Zoogloea sp. TaxID=49181 RepID=UPI00141633EF|nr:MAG: CPBP family intramembrane metalloprotease [Zoogloea sp.]
MAFLPAAPFLSLPVAAFACLGLAILAAALPLQGRARRGWGLLFLAACGLGVIGDTLDPAALASLAALGLACAAGRHPRLAAAAPWLAGSLALLLALHLCPGFQPLLLADGLVLSPGASPFTLRAGFDKAAAGLLLLACFAPRCRRFDELGQSLRDSLPLAALTVVLTLAAAWLSGRVVPDPKWPAVAPGFLAINLLFTCVAEEAFFRGLIQEGLHRRFASLGPALPVGLSSMLFAAAHLGGGVLHATIAGLAGLGYALVHARSRRIEAAILTHFAVNAVHFLGFTYPGLAP